MKSFDLPLIHEMHGCGIWASRVQFTYGIYDRLPLLTAGIFNNTGFDKINLCTAALGC